VIIASLFAIGSTISLIFSLWPQFDPWRSSGSNAGRSIEPPVVSASQSTSDPAPNDDCDWIRGEKIDDCISRLGRGRDVDEATRLAFRGRGMTYFENGQFASAEQAFTVSLNNEKDENEDVVIHLMRGLARLDQNENQLALDDCSKADTFVRRFRLNVGLLLSKIENPSAVISACRGVALSNLDRHREAIPELDAAIDGGYIQREIYDARSKSRLALGDAQGSRSDKYISASLSADGFFRILAKESR
jgi:hypothetical protein